MMEALSLFPEGFHPTMKSYGREGIQRLKIPARLYSGPVKYYIADFGSSVYGNENGVFEVYGSATRAQDRDAPELQVPNRYDPKLLDVFTLGNVYRKEILAVL